MSLADATRAVVRGRAGTAPDPRDTARAVLWLLHPHDPATRLGVLALASRVLRESDPGSPVRRFRIAAGQAWASPVLRTLTRRVVARMGDQVVYRNKRGEFTVAESGFHDWAMRTGARPV